MKRPILTTLALSLGLAAGAAAQERYDYRTTPEGDCEITDPDYPPPPRRVILNRIVGDLRVAKEELDKGLFEMRDELRRLIHGDSFTHRADETYGRYDRDSLHRARRADEIEREAYARRRAAMEDAMRREREIDMRRDRAWELYRPRRSETDRAPTGIRLPETRRDDDFAPLPDVTTPPLRPRGSEPKLGERPPAIESIAPERPKAKPEKAPVNSTAESSPKPQPELKPAPQPEIAAKKETPKENPPVTREFTEAEKRNFPLAAKTDRPGYVRSPYPPFELLDVREMKPGDLAMEPEGERIFRIPE